MKSNCDIKGNGFGKSFGLILFALFIEITAQAQPDYPPAKWVQAYSGHWYTGGNGHKFAVIHDMEGYYLSTVSYIQGGGGSGQVSIHYCVNGLQNGSDSQGHNENRPSDVPAGDITQMVREQYYAWHARCLNTWSFGTEHEGFASNPAWYSDAMYKASAALQRHLCDTWSIPKDRNHIIAHGEWQNSAWVTWMAANFPSIDATCNNHTDPGVYWNWNYFMSLITGAPAAPSNLNATPLSTTQIKLTWSDNSTNESGFRLERSASSSGPWTLLAVLGVNVTSYTNSNLTPSTPYYYRVYATSTNGNSGYSNVRGATTGNSAPVLVGIGSKTVTEGKTLTFTASASDTGIGVNALISDFEAYANGANTVMFRQPSYSGSSRGLDTNTTSTTVASSFPAGHVGTRVLKATWAFAAGAINPWLRLTTAGAPGGLPNPVIDLRQIVKFDIYTDKPLKVGIAVRESGNAAGTPIGSDGGSANAIEWVGVTNQFDTAPAPNRTVNAGSWQTLQFNIPYEPARSFFNGDGVVSSATGLGVLEHLAFVPLAGGSGTYNVYLDNFSVVYSNVLTFSLDAGAPSGATIDSRTGVFSWTPTEAQGAGVYDITVRVTDNGTPPLTDFETISVAVDETNAAPNLAVITSKSVVEGSLLTFTASATDGDIPTNHLEFSLDPGAPAGAEIDPTTGVFTWTPTEEQGAGTYPITVRVTDDAPEPLSVTRTFTAAVGESNLAPVIAAVADREIAPGTSLVISNSASDADLPANALTFSLDQGVGIGASVDPNSGVFTWTPNASQAESTNSFTMRVTDNGIPPLSSTTVFHVMVGTNPPPPIVATASISGETITIQWNSIATNTYRVLYADDPSGTNWNILGSDVIAAGASSSITDTLGTGRRFYRVKKMESE